MGLKLLKMPKNILNITFEYDVNICNWSYETYAKIFLSY